MRDKESLKIEKINLLLHVSNFSSRFDIKTNMYNDWVKGLEIIDGSISWGSDEDLGFYITFADKEGNTYELNEESVYFIVRDSYTREIYYNVIDYLELPELPECSDDNDNVNSPKHYSSDAIEVIDFLDQVAKKYKASQAFYVANIIKYVARAPMKNGLEDLKKAQWYLNRLVKNWSE
ncbi:DUF3310 domain-containing protein [Macrococcus capreoli]|uniref:DUF3310 domain-containing protein n=1 Tax=Macrococcus capreoli TaxID=2982690 RepID=UPI003EE53FC6